MSKETHDDVTVLETLDPADPFSNYSEAQYGNRTVRWIKKIVAAKQEPFFAFIGTSGPHLGVIPAPWHREMTVNLKGADGEPIKAPRNPAFNYHAKDHHPLLATAPILDEKAIADEDMLMRDRWGTLFSIDDMVVGVADAMKELGIADHTYMLFTSGNLRRAALRCAALLCSALLCSAPQRAMLPRCSVLLRSALH